MNTKPVEDMTKFFTNLHELWSIYDMHSSDCDAESWDSPLYSIQLESGKTWTNVFNDYLLTSGLDKDKATAFIKDSMNSHAHFARCLGQFLAYLEVNDSSTDRG